MNGRDDAFLAEVLQDVSQTMRCATDALKVIRMVMANEPVPQELLNSSLCAVSDLMNRLAEETDGLLDELGTNHGGASSKKIPLEA